MGVTDVTDKSTLLPKKRKKIKKDRISFRIVRRKITRYQMKINIGSTIIGKSGKKLIVDLIEGDILHCGDLKILASAVIKVIPPTTSFKQGDSVRYISENRPLTIGDRVKIVSTGEMGRLGVWFRSRNSAIVDLDDGSHSGWKSLEDLVRVDLDEECPHIEGDV